MKGQMMMRPLRIADILEYAALVHPSGEIVSARVEGDRHRQSYAETAARTRQLANGLRALGIEPGDRVATLAWNGYRHFELYYAISGIGAVCHTINPRLSAEQMIYIVAHAADRILCLDLTFVPLVEKLKDHLPGDLRYVIMTDRAHMPENSLNALCYEEILADQPTTIDWPEFPEDTAAALCYTSGTTGNPKGTLYTHRSTVIHAMLIAISLSAALKPGSKILPVVPLFHVNAWGLPYAAPLTGASLVMPGPGLDGASLFDLMDDEAVFSAWGVPTVWMGLLAEVKKRGRLPEGFKDVVIGGSAAPRPMIETFEDRGVNVCHAWGMTEMSPVGTQGNLPVHLNDLPREDRMRLKAKQGRQVFGVDLKIVDEDGRRQPHDGEHAGILYVRGNTVTSGYYNNPEANAEAFDDEGWFATGDIATIDAHGFLTITDRAKDLIKSGGEWISSLDLENIAMGHPDVANCAVIAVPHPKWDERPLLVVVPEEGKTPKLSEINAMLAEHFAKWQLPDAMEIVESLPLTATGKVSKLTLRKQFADYKLADAV
ncbi:long-chain fatty acid--CoA ligase [Defluviimonas sp. 20V17]|uniref:3-methylmercaptopropionyl-CoA ligase n=1 Tax=Allgaiera indica TaxID=765699 RepID=A0AAN5A1Y1_9RHOB|nr:long-chain fatty acid--CoA ligase [Allgaiera indica]KDB05230.1 long-chain fatty acid--CoA ligase [Defluviimonas sp. 20V17]GHE04978.1 long-chain-fatty-acid--CoA ligase [Allgaiera indica]SDX60559.1 fatty-acyl-CoA synthase [Allgaiera indica]